jgi:ribosome-binding protein aMBF1 (putative translation factor)
VFGRLLRVKDPELHSYAQEKKAMAKTKNALKIIDRLVGNDGELRQWIADETINASVARMVYDARTEAGLTQQALADLVGTKQPVIARLEDADYRGHSLTMLNRIAKALHKRLTLRMKPAVRRPRRKGA